MQILLFFTAQAVLPDGGPVYAETDLSRFIAEPWNAISSLAIIIPAVYFFVKISPQFRTYAFLSYCIPLLFLGGTGSTLFHAFRVSKYFLFLDFMPIILLSLSISIYFWVKVLKPWWWVFIIVPPFIIARFLVFEFVEPPHSVNISYFISGVMILLPGILLLYKTHFKHGLQLLLAAIFFIASLLFRYSDIGASGLLYMGTHWLWHVFSAAGAFFVGNYIYIMKKERVIE